MSGGLLEVEALSVAYQRGPGPAVEALRGVSLSAQTGEVVGIVGESGSGKSTLAAALIGLMAPAAQVTGGSIRLRGMDLADLSADQMRALRGREIAMVFQDPMTSFNPVIPLGQQLVDYQHNLQGPSRAQKRQRAVAMLARVGISDAVACMGRFPHELSGGMRQRAAVAAALLMTPSVLVADEPTTALDVTMEAQVLHLLRELRRDYHGAIIVVTHHLGVIGELCDRVYVMYAGQVVEQALVDDIYHAPRHPYTAALIACDPGSLARLTPVLPTIPGRPPDLAPPPKGCAFAPRCGLAMDLCRTTPPPRVQVSPTQSALCHRVQG